MPKTPNELKQNTIKEIKARLWELGLTAKDINIDSLLDTLLTQELQAKNQRIVERIKSNPNPYPEDVFLEPTDEQLKQIHEWLLKKWGFPIDRLSGYLMRKGYKLGQEDAIQIIKSEIE